MDSLIERTREAPQKEKRPRKKDRLSMYALIDRSKDFLERIQNLPQNVLTINIPVIESKEAALRKVLAKINKDPANNAFLPFAVFSQLHFARFLLLEGPNHPGAYATTLVFIANVDGPSEAFIEELLTQMSRGMDLVLENCLAYPAKSKRTRETRKRYLQQHTIRSQATYTNTVGRTALSIRQEDQLRDALQLFLNELNPASFRSAGALRQTIIEFVTHHPEVAWALASRAQPSLLWRTMENIRFAALSALGILILLWGWPLLLTWVVTLRLREFEDPEDTHRPPLSRLIQLRSSEDIAAHNPFAAVGYVKDGPLRRLTARSLLAAAQVVLRHVFNKGNLAGVPLLGLDGVDTIHFAQWTMVDNDKRLLFTSNYDGSLESYMVDFIDKVAWGLNLIFSNGKGYPRTRWIVHEGARNEQRFKDYLGNHQIENQVWFSAYPHLTAVNIANNAAIRDGLRGKMTESQAQAWLNRL